MFTKVENETIDERKQFRFKLKNIRSEDKLRQGELREQEGQEERVES